MKADKINISHFKFVSIKCLEIKRTVGEHALATVSGCISDQDLEEYKLTVLEHIWVTITAEDESGEKKTLMTGVVAGFSFEPQPHDVYMTLVIKSGTYLMDTAVHFRSFQNNGLTWRNVLNSITQPYGEFGIIGEESLDTTHVDFLLQYRETDWRFIKRIVSYLGLAVTADVAREGVFFYVGNRNHASYALPAVTRYRVSKYIDKYMEREENKQGAFLQQDFWEYQVSTRDVYDLWDRLMIGNDGGYICDIYSEYRQGELIHTYTMRSLNALRPPRLFNDCQQGCSFTAMVKGVMQDKVKIMLMEDENGNQEVTRWFPYSTGYSSPDGAGWYCMPEIDDQVRLQLPNQMEETAYVISSVHLETNTARKNPEYKSLRTKYGKELLFTPDSVELTNNKGMSIKIKDKKGVSIISDRDISITAKGNMTLSSEDASLMVAGTDSVDIRQSGSGLHIEKDVTFSGGKFRIQ